MDRKSRLMASACNLSALGFATGLYALATVSAQANPTGGVVTSGGATISAPNPTTVQITQSTNQAIINWQSFGIAKGETVDFNQLNSSSVTLNRVVGNDLSAIYGTLTANGIVMLVNPNGIVFSPGSHVDVGGLVATMADITDANFQAGKYNFSKSSANPNAAVVNRGDISIKDSGLAALVAPSVRNSGVITARLGQVALAGAKTFTVDFHGDGLLSFDASSAVTELPRQANGKPVKALVVNSGEISAAGGTVSLSARAVKGVIDHAINTSGVIAATSVGAVDGKIVLSGGDDGTVEVSGKLDATGKSAGETGGTVVATGADVRIDHGTHIDASGSVGGGSIAIGSDGTGTGAWSSRVSVARGARLAANAIDNGNGGRVSVLGDKHTTFAGKISAHGGANGGNGGTAEVSSHADVKLTGKVYLTAAAGKTGTFLLDPATLEITDDNNAVNSDNVVSRGWLEGQSADANIDLQATGQITIDAMAGKLINLATASGNSFSLTSTESGGITFVDPQTEIRTQGGSIYLTATGGSLTNIGKLTTNGGDIGLAADGDITLANTVDAGIGSVALQSNSGSITALNASATVAGSYLYLSAAGSVGNIAAPLATSTQQLTVASGGDIVVANDQVLTLLDITNSHAAPGAINTLSVTSPSLTFAVSDSGSQYTLATVTGTDLLTFNFAGDQGIAVGHVEINAGGSVDLTASAGDIVGTGNSGDGVIAGQLFLNANQGSVGSAAAPVNAGVSQLVVATAGNLYVADAQPISYLDITSTHTNPTDIFAFQVTAPGLTFDVADGSDGYHLNTVAAGDGTTFNFSGDRPITVGSIDMGPTGTVNLSVSSDSGAIVGDGTAPVAIQAGSVSVFAPDTIGLAASSLTIATNDLSASTYNGGVFVTVPTTLTGSTVTSLDYISAGGAVIVTASQGDLNIQNIYANAGDVTITAGSGQVTNNGFIAATGADGTPGAIALNSSGTLVAATGSLGTQIETWNPGATAGVGTVVLTQTRGIQPLASGMTPPASDIFSAAALGQTSGKPSTDNPAPDSVDTGAGVLQLRALGAAPCVAATTVGAGAGGTIVLGGDGSKAAVCQSAMNSVGAGEKIGLATGLESRLLLTRR